MSKMSSWREEQDEGCNKCFPCDISSASCRYCGARAVLKRERVEEMLLEYTWMNYAVNRAMYEMNPNQGETPNPVRANEWLRTTLRKDHPNYIDPKTLGYGVRDETI